MTRDPAWFFLGLVLIIAGVHAVAAIVRRLRPPEQPDPYLIHIRFDLDLRPFRDAVQRILALAAEIGKALAEKEQQRADG